METNKIGEALSSLKEEKNSNPKSKFAGPFYIDWLYWSLLYLKLYWICNAWFAFSNIYLQNHIRMCYVYYRLLNNTLATETGWNSVWYIRVYVIAGRNYSIGTRYHDIGNCLLKFLLTLFLGLFEGFKSEVNSVRKSCTAQPGHGLHVEFLSLIQQSRNCGM